LLGDGGRRELPFRDLRHRRDFGGRAGDEAFREVDSSSGMIRRSITSMPRFLASAITVCAGDAGKEAVGDRRVDLAVLDEEDVGAGAFGDAALPVEHHGVGIALALGLCLEMVQIM
jgi:hypothetical protein